MALCRSYVHLEQLDEPINADFCAAASSRGLVLARRGGAGEPADLLVEYRAARDADRLWCQRRIVRIRVLKSFREQQDSVT
jgi:hypothetical protein